MPCIHKAWDLIVQVFISYGRKSNGELLLSYGFVPKEGTNPTDSVELSLSLKKSDKCYKEKVEALKKHGLSAWVLQAYVQWNGYLWIYLFLLLEYFLTKCKNRLTVVSCYQEKRKKGFHWFWCLFVVYV